MIIGDKAASRQSRTAPGPGGAAVPAGEVEYQTPGGGGARLTLRLEVNHRAPGLLDAKDQTWELMQRTQAPNQRVQVVEGRRTTLSLDPRGNRAQYRVRLGQCLLLTASAIGGGDPGATAESAARAPRWSQLENAVGSR
jgi:hypothetical protein